MSIGKVVAERMSEQGIPQEGEPEVTQVEVTPADKTEVMDAAANEAQRAEQRSIALPPKAREELKALLRTQNEAQERIRLVLGTLEEALEVPAGWVIRDVDEGFVEYMSA